MFQLPGLSNKVPQNLMIQDLYEVYRIHGSEIQKRHSGNEISLLFNVWGLYWDEAKPGETQQLKAGTT